MATKRQKERKKKDRENKAKARVLARRHKMRLATRDESRARALEFKFKDKIKPIVKDPEKLKDMEAVEQKKIKDRLERNMQILKALEDEYKAECERRGEIGAELERQGHETLQEKFAAIEQRAREIYGEDSAQNNS